MDYTKKLLTKVIMIRLDEQTYRYIKKHRINFADLCRDAIKKYILDRENKKAC